MVRIPRWAIGAAITVVAAVFAIVFSRSAPQARNEKDPVRIGVFLALTGDAAAYGVPIMNGGILAQEEINAAGGIGGRRLEFIVEDDKCDPATGAAAAQKLVNVDKVKIAFGSACSGATLAAAPIFEESKTLLISPGAESPDISHAGDYIFRTVPSGGGQAKAAARYSWETLKARKAAVISEQTDYGQSVRKVFIEEFKKLGGTILADEVFQGKDTDLRSQALKIKEQNPAIVYMVPQTPASAELIIRQLRAQEVRAQIVAEGVTMGRDLIAQQPQLLKGVIGTEPDFDEKDEAAASLVAKYERRFKEKTPYPNYTSYMYSQTYLIKEGIERVGEDPTKLKDWLYTVKSWKHAMGELSFDQNGDAIAPYSIKQVQADGTVKELQLVRPE